MAKNGIIVTSIYLRYLVYSTLLITSVSAFCRFGSDSNCVLPCRCQNNDACDPMTGACPNGCAAGHPPGYDWTGDGCQVGNVAYMKNANQTGIFESLYATEAVDGVLGVIGNNYNCAHPYAPNGDNAGWTVDLGSPHVIQNVTIYNTYNSGGYERMTQFEITVSGLSTASCGTYDGVVGRGENVTIQCEPSTVGQFVHFLRSGGYQVDRVTICEVIVWGYREISCTNCPNNCNPVWGCELCPIGKALPDCSEDCPAGSYGQNCTETCGRCVNGEACDAETGACRNGCEAWNIGTMCNIELNKYGYTSETISIGTITSNSIEVIWEQGRTIQDSVASYYEYAIEYKIQGTSQWTSFANITHEGGQTQRRTTITNLMHHNTDYEITIKMCAKWEGRRRCSNYPTQTVKTLCIAPNDPVIENTETTKPTTTGGDGKIKVYYQKPTDSGCTSLQSLVLQFKETSREWRNQDLPKDETEYTIIVAPGEYMIKLVATNDENLDSTSETKSITVQAFIPTPSPTPVPTPSPTPAPTEDTTADPAGSSGGRGGGDTILIAVIAVVAVLVVVAVIVVLLVLRHKEVICKKKPPTKEALKRTIRRLSDGTGTVGQENPMFSPEAVAGPSEASLDKDSEGNIYQNDVPLIDRGPIPIKELEPYVKRVRTSLLSEFKELPQEDHSKCQLAETDENKLKNRFMNIHAYDHSRVELDLIDDDPDSDYINANYINGYGQDKVYVATQGPKPHTFYDFWRMVWQLKSNRIVMVTNLVENGKTKCDQYWPASVKSTVEYGVLTVTMDTEEAYADYTIRTFTVVKRGEERAVTQFHFTSWEDKKRPLYGAAPLLSFRKKIRSHDSTATGPLIIHCSAGVGRTGTLIATDILLQQASMESQVDIFSCVKKMRDERMNMVQTKDQYVFLHDALVEAIKTEETCYPVTDFQEVFDRLCKQEKTGGSDLERQYEVLNSMKNKNPIKIKEGWKDQNKHKNRDADIVPSDTDRPYLMSKSSKGNNYINAVFTDTFKAHDSYIVTQMPLPNTISDFWRLVYDQKVLSIVMLDEMDDTDETCLPYWPTEEGSSEKYGHLEVELVKEERDPNAECVMTRQLKVSLGSEKKGDDGVDPDAKIVCQFQLTSWPRDQDFPSKKGDLLDLQDALYRWQNQRKSDGGVGSTIVHCMNGASRSGIFCAMSYILDKLKTEHEIDTFLAVRYVANRRHQFIDSLEQYKFLYELVIECLSRFDTYANFQQL